MQKMYIQFTLALLFMFLSASLYAQDPKLIGTWKPVTYEPRPTQAADINKIENAMDDETMRLLMQYVDSITRNKDSIKALFPIPDFPPSSEMEYRFLANGKYRISAGPGRWQEGNFAANPKIKQLMLQYTLLTPSEEIYSYRFTKENHLVLTESSGYTVVLQKTGDR